MRKMTILAAMLALAVMMMAASPAMAQDRFDRLENRLENRLDRFDDGFFFVDGFFSDGFDRFDRFDRFDFDDGISQDFDQEADSGDVDQSFEASSDGDNSNQSVGIQSVTNTGNAQSQFGFTQFDSEIDDFEFEDGGADIDVSPEFDLESDQSVDQAAAAG
ncbi:MAG: hypothetical protein AVDCRST_MAG93-4160 [uncultured Chloroflexia bacterium]|uniref:Uncharacterized protein n=1 Tax=uncultured Chloroflexia bacterium TaxID=1672391 RepID=A0A6J4K342_9CHLR|nr:MAG: hypothetical protein AVDCRST_MAG93-4160 [uncultured Chloroflexia bacterium]